MDSGVASMQILNHYRYSFLYKLTVFTVNVHENFCIAGLNHRAVYATACGMKMALQNYLHAWANFLDI